MIDDMGIFRTSVTVENPARPGVTSEVPNVMVDTGSEYTWLPRAVLEELGLVPIRAVRFVTADGREIEREVCFGNIYAGGSSAPDILVFASGDDMVLLGAHTLEGLNLRIDMLTKQLVPAGPVPAAAAKRGMASAGISGRRSTSVVASHVSSPPHSTSGMRSWR